MIFQVEMYIESLYTFFYFFYFFFFFLEIYALFSLVISLTINLNLNGTMMPLVIVLSVKTYILQGNIKCLIFRFLINKSYNIVPTAEFYIVNQAVDLIDLGGLAFELTKIL